MDGIEETRCDNQQPPPLIGGGELQCGWCMCFNDCEYHKNIMSGCYPPGFTFEPSDVKIIDCYLKKKIMNEELPPLNTILEIDLYKFNPDQFAEHYKLLTGKKETCYFLTRREWRSLNGNRPNRSAGDGFWKAISCTTAIEKYRGGPTIGFKATLVWYKGKAAIKMNKTDWIMYEYTYNNGCRRKRSIANDMKLDEWFLCKIQKSGRSSNNSTTNGNPTAEENIIPVSGHLDDPFDQRQKSWDTY